MQINQDLNRIKKNATHPFLNNGKLKSYVKFQQKILNCRIVGAWQSFQIFRQNNWFLKNNRVLSKFLHRILHDLISIINFIIIKSVHKKTISVEKPFSVGVSFFECTRSLQFPLLLMCRLLLVFVSSVTCKTKNNSPLFNENIYKKVLDFEVKHRKIRMCDCPFLTLLHQFCFTNR